MLLPFVDRVGKDKTLCVLRRKMRVNFIYDMSSSTQSHPIRLYKKTLYGARLQARFRRYVRLLGA
jgi:hypothetical protein